MHYYFMLCNMGEGRVSSGTAHYLGRRWVQNYEKLYYIIINIWPFQDRWRGKDAQSHCSDWLLLKIKNHQCFGRHPFGLYKDCYHNIYWTLNINIRTQTGVITTVILQYLGNSAAKNLIRSIHTFDSPSNRQISFCINLSVDWISRLNFMQSILFFS